MIYGKFKDKISSNSVLLSDIFNGAVWFPWEKQEDLYYMADDHYAEKRESSVVFHEMMKDVISENRSGSWKENYKIIIDRFKVSDETAKELLQLERQAVIKYGLPWLYIKNLINTAEEKNCRIYFINNSAYDPDTVRCILKKCGYAKYVDILNEYDALEYGGKFENFFYIGQNKEISSKANHAFMLEDPLKVLRGNESEELIRLACGSFASYNKAVSSAGFGICQKLVAFRFYEELKQNWKKGSRCNANPFFAGYYMLGMHVLGISKWIIKEARRSGAGRILFCARDGYLIYRAYELIRAANSGLPEGQYIQASRRALLPVILKSETDFYLPPGILFYQSSPRSTMRFFWCFTKMAALFDFECRSMEENIDFLERDLADHGFDFDRTFTDKASYEKFILFFLENYYSREKHMLLREAVCTYYADIREDDIIFDAGYSGKLAKAISDICPALSGALYLYTDGDCSELMERSGDIQIRSFYHITPCINNMFREYMIAENGPTCAGIRMKEQSAEPVFDCREFAGSRAIRDMHTGALAFIHDFIHLGNELFFKMPFKEQEISLPFEGFLRYIPDIDLEMFQTTFQDDYYTGMPMHQNWAEQYKGMINALPPLEKKQINETMILELLRRKNIRIAYWGTGKIYRRMRGMYSDIVPDILIDNNISDQYVDGIQVKTLDMIENIRDYFVIVVNNFYADISSQLEATGLAEYKNYIWYKYLIRR